MIDSVSVAANEPETNPGMFRGAMWLVKRTQARQLAALPRARPSKCFGVFLLASRELDDAVPSDTASGSKRTDGLLAKGKRPGEDGRALASKSCLLGFIVSLIPSRSDEAWLRRGKLGTCLNQDRVSFLTSSAFTIGGS